MSENNQSNLVQRTIAEQDMLSYFMFAHIDEHLFIDNIDSEFNFTYTKLPEFCKEHPEIFESLSMSNLVFYLDAHNKDAVKMASEQIMKRFRNGEHIFGRNAEYQFVGPPIEARNVVFSKLGKEDLEEVKKSILINLENLKEKDPRAYALANSFHYYASIDNFLSSYENGNITPEKLDYLERVAEENPYILEKMDFELLRDEIFEMGEDFITRVAKYPNMSTKLIGLQSVSPEIFETVKSGIIDLEKSTRKQEALELEQAGLTYAFRNYKTAEGLTFEEILNRGITEIKSISVKTEEGYTLIDPNEGTKTPLDAIHKKYDIREKYAKTLVDELAKTAEEIEKSEDVEYIDVDGKKVKQIKLHGDMSILAHSSDSGFKEDKEIKDGDFKKTWRHKQDVSAHLTSSCYMNQNFTGHVPAGNNGVLMVFAKLTTDDVGLMGPRDINTHVRSYVTEAGEATSMNASELPENSRRIYAEVPVEKRDPDYLLIFDDTPEEVLKNTYKCAVDFDIPVLYMDKVEIEKNQLENLDRLTEEFKKTADVSVLSTLVSTYETNVAGWLLNRDKSIEDKSLTAGINNERFREDFETRGQEIFTLIQDYITVIEAGDKSRIPDLEAISKIMQAEIDKYELANKGNVPISKTAPSLDYQGVIDRINSLDLGEVSNEISTEDTASAKREVDIAGISLSAVEQGEIGLSDVQALREKDKDRENKNREGQNLGTKDAKSTEETTKNQGEDR